MTDNTKNLENTNLTDEQTTEVAGGFPIFKPFPRNAKLDDKQTDQVSGGTKPRASKNESDEDQLGTATLRAKDSL